MIEVGRSSDAQLMRELFREYQAGVNAPVCFASFDVELAALPAPYAAILIAHVDGSAAGCVALKPLTDEVGEAKRLYVRPAFRQLGLGERLMRGAADEARRLGYTKVRLDTLPFMARAIGLYQRLGYVPIDRYNTNPEPQAHFFELHI